jgi:hypothetical protein
MLASIAPAADLFPMGTWYEGGVGAARQNVVPEDPAEAARMYDRDFADIAAHGLNVVVVPNTPPNHHKALLDAAEKHHLKLIIELGLDGGDIGHMIRGTKPLDMAKVHDVFETTLKPVMNHPALWRVQLLDEPPPGEPVERYAKIADALRKLDPQHPPFCCLAGIGHVRDFAKTTKSDLAAWDFYPITVKHPEGDSAPINALLKAADSANKQAREANAHTWAVLQTFAITGRERYPTPAETRAMTWLSLGSGSRGVFWFLYGTQPLDAAHKTIMSGLVDRKDVWDEVATLTKRIGALQSVLADLAPAESSLASSDGNVHVLTDWKGDFYVFVVNTDTVNAKKITTHFGTPSEVAGEAEVVRLPEKHKMPVTHEGAQVSWEVELQPGDGAVYEIQ